MLELIGGCLFVIGRVFRLPLSAGSIVGVILTMPLYFVFLSYVFLMNTRYNKSRIIEEGWMNVLKNMVSSCKGDVIAQDNNPIASSNGGEGLNNAKGKPDVPRIFSIPTRNKISKSEKIVLTTLNNTSLANNKEADYEKQQPTCSFNNVDSKHDSTDCIKKDKGVKDEKSITSIRKRMISDLLSHIDNEGQYIKRLTHFVDLEEAHKSGKDINTSNYDCEELRVDTLPHFIGCSERKLDLRVAKLQKLFHCREENDTYETYFEQFVDMEENFLENGC